MASHVGIDPKRDINFVIHPPAEAMQLLADGKIDALMGCKKSLASTGRRGQTM
jgi:ABC-type nitrate/sulfonate/bicarbonate transport system substrate-binding protein